MPKSSCDLSSGSPPPVIQKQVSLLGVSLGRCIEGAQKGGGDMTVRGRLNFQQTGLSNSSEVQTHSLTHTSPCSADHWTGFARPVCRGGSGGTPPRSRKEESLFFVLEALSLVAVLFLNDHRGQQGGEGRV